MSDYQHFWYQSIDGLELYARDYQHENPKGTILCMPGLTRNSADFNFICDYLHRDYRLIAVDQRGRGMSEYDPNPENYHPGTYIQDMMTLLDALELPKVILLGTSLGGLMSMLMAAMNSEKVAALIINDMGPEINPEGLQRIQSYVGKQKTIASWEQAVAQAREVNAGEFPDLDDQGWLDFTRALYREDAEGIPVLAYDAAISSPMDNNMDVAVPPDLWPQFKLIVDIPLLLIRGQTSDILTIDCVKQMQAVKPDMHYCEVAKRGHAPLLNEPVCVRAIDAFLAAL